jgi:hypothetical protein
MAAVPSRPAQTGDAQEIGLSGFKRRSPHLLGRGCDGEGACVVELIGRCVLARTSSSNLIGRRSSAAPTDGDNIVTLDNHSDSVAGVDIDERAAHRAVALCPRPEHNAIEAALRLSAACQQTARNRRTAD